MIWAIVGLVVAAVWGLITGVCLGSWMRDRVLKEATKEERRRMH